MAIPTNLILDLHSPGCRLGLHRWFCMAGGVFWYPDGGGDLQEVSIWRGCLMQSKRWSSPSGCVDYPVLAAARCTPKPCTASQLFGQPTLQNTEFVTEAGLRLKLSDLLDRWVIHGLRMNSVVSLTRAVWGPIAEVVVRNKWPVSLGQFGKSRLFKALVPA